MSPSYALNGGAGDFVSQMQHDMTSARSLYTFLLQAAKSRTTPTSKLIV